MLGMHEIHESFSMIFELNIENIYCIFKYITPIIIFS
jgi:hypothetical protein